MARVTKKLLKEETEQDEGIFSSAVRLLNDNKKVK